MAETYKDLKIKRLNSFEKKVLSDLEKINNDAAHEFLFSSPLDEIAAAPDGCAASSTLDMVWDQDIYYDFGYWPENCERDRMKAVIKFFLEDHNAYLGQLPDDTRNMILANALVYGKWWR